MQVNTFDSPRPRVLVVSHERSGTHFLMNSVSACFGYVSAPWIDLDQHQFNINYHHPPSIVRALASFRDVHLANIVKSHHGVDFLGPVIDELTGLFHVLYVVRDPRDVMRSYWRFLHGLGWDEGPREPTCAEFIRAAPRGRLMRYQTAQKPTMLERWRDHVAGWLELAAGRARVVVIRYEDLDAHYDAEIERIGAAIGLEPGRCERPDRDRNVISPPVPPAITRASGEYDDADEALFRAALGGRLAPLGY